MHYSLTPCFFATSATGALSEANTKKSAIRPRMQSANFSRVNTANYLHINLSY
jgi:hypothetical protein